MPEDVYQPPSSELRREPDAPRLAAPAGFSIATAFGDGWRAMVSSFPLWLGIGAVGFLLIMVSVVTVIGIVLLVPVLSWGMLVAGLAMFDGRGRFSDLFAGFSIYGRAVAYGLALIVLYYLASAPGILGQMAIESQDSPAAVLLGGLVGFAWGFVTIRFTPAWFFMVEHDMGPLGAMRASWTYTRGQWGRLILFMLATVGVALLGIAALGIGLIPATAVIGFAYVSVYRQITQSGSGPARGEAR